MQATQMMQKCAMKFNVYESMSFNLKFKCINVWKFSFNNQSPKVESGMNTKCVATKTSIMAKISSEAVPIGTHACFLLFSTNFTDIKVIVCQDMHFSYLFWCLDYRGI